MFHSHVPFTAQSYHTLLPITFPRGRNAAEDADADTVSMHSESRSSATDSSDAAFQGTGTEDKDFETSSNDARTRLPDTAIAHCRSEWLPTVTQAGYFVFPDPFSSGRRASSTLERTKSYAVTSSEDEMSIAEDKSEIEDHEGTPPKNASPKRKTKQDPAASVKETKQFLPLLMNDPNYPRNPTLNRRLEKINKRLRRATTCSEEPPTQSDRTPPVSGIHPAFRQAESHSTNDNEALTALRAEVEQLTAEVKALERSAILMDSRYAEVAGNILMNQERLVGGWERIRNELFHIKVMQERPRGRVNTVRNMEGRW
jgi:hypothetical protein